MAITIIGDISKIKLANGNYVSLKDAQARQDLATLLNNHAVEALGAAAWQPVASSITASGLPSASVVKDYVDAQVGSINKFDIVIADSLPTASADTMYKIYMIPKASAQSQNAKDEYITVRSGAEGSYTYSWEKIGDTEIDLSDYAKYEDLGNMAYADTASGSVSTIDSLEINPIVISGDITISTAEATATLAKADYQPDGTVTAPEITISGDDVTVGTGLSGGSAASFSEGTFTPAELKSGFYTPGSTPSKAADSFSAGSFTKGNAVVGAIEGVVVSVSSTTVTTDDDYETLIFSTASTAPVMSYDATYVAPTFTEGAFDPGSVTTIDTSKFSGGSKDPDTFTPNVVPTMATTTVKNVSGATASAPAFTGATVTGFQVTGVTYDKASGNTTFSQTITPTVKTITRTSKTVSVLPDVEE